MNYKEIGEKIKIERTKKQLTQIQLAESADVSRTFISYVEKGQRVISLETLEKVSKCLGVSYDYLLNEERPPLEKEAIHRFEQMIEGRSQEEIDRIFKVIEAMGHTRK